MSAPHGISVTVRPAVDEGETLITLSKGGKHWTHSEPRGDYTELEALLLVADCARNYTDALQGTEEPYLDFCTALDLDPLERDTRECFEEARGCYYALTELLGSENALYELCYGPEQG